MANPGRLQVLTDIWHGVQKLGTQHALEPELKKTVLFANLCSSCGLVLALLIMPPLALGGAWLQLQFVIAAAFFFSGALVLSSISAFTLARIALVLGSNAAALCVATMMANVASGLAVSLATLFMPLALFFYNEKKPLFLSAALSPLLGLGLLLNLALKSQQRGVALGLDFLGASLVLVMAATLFFRIYKILNFAQIKAEKNLFQRNRLVGFVSHDIQGNLGIIENSLKMIERNHQVTSQSAGKRHYERALKAFQLLTVLTDQIRAEKGIQPFEGKTELSPLAFQQCMEYVEFAFSDRLQAKGVHFSIQDKTDGDSRFQVEPLAFIHTVLASIVSNALKYSHPGGVITFLLEKKDSSLELSIQDTGLGMSTEEQMVLFDEQRSYARPGTAGERDGSGLSMHLAKKYITSYGGTIAVESIEHVGTTITLSIPTAPEMASAAEISGSAPLEEAS